MAYCSSSDEKVFTDSENDSFDGENEEDLKEQITILLAQKLHYQSRRAVMEYYNDGIKPDPSGIRDSFRQPAVTFDYLSQKQREINREQRTLNELERPCVDMEKQKEAAFYVEEVAKMENREKKFAPLFEKHQTDFISFQEEMNLKEIELENQTVADNDRM